MSVDDPREGRERGSQLESRASFRKGRGASTSSSSVACDPAVPLIIRMIEGVAPAMFDSLDHRSGVQ